MQEIKGSKNESAGVSKGAALLFLTYSTAGTWSCWISHNINIRVLELLLQMTTDVSISFHSRYQHL